MSKQVISQRMEQVCDACGATKEWELVGADQNQVIIDEMQEWYSVGRKLVIDGRMTQLAVDACSLNCVVVAAAKMVPQPESPADKIDLASLRTTSFNPLN
jgi:hypothetical protein